MAAFADQRATQLPHLLPQAASVEKLRGIFQKCDLDSNGRINKREFIKVIRNHEDVAHFFGLPMQIHQEDGSRDKMERTFQQIDLNSDREITWEEFQTFYTKLRGGKDAATARQHPRAPPARGAAPAPKSAPKPAPKPPAKPAAKQTRRTEAQVTGRPAEAESSDESSGEESDGGIFGFTSSQFDEGITAARTGAATAARAARATAASLASHLRGEDESDESDDIRGEDESDESDDSDSDEE